MKKNINKKIGIVDEINILATEAVMTIAIDYSKIKSLDIKYIRQSLFKKDIKVKVFKNTLAKRAFRNTLNESLSDFFSGQVLMIFSNNDISEPIKMIDRLKTKYNEIKIRSICVYGKLFVEKNIKELINLPDKLGALAQFNMCLKSPVLTIATYIKNPCNQLYFLLKILSEKQK